MEVVGKSLHYPISWNSAALLTGNAAFLVKLHTLEEPYTLGYQLLAASFKSSKVVPLMVARLVCPHHEHSIHAVGIPSLHLHPPASRIGNTDTGSGSAESSAPPLPWALLLVDENTPADPFLALVWRAANVPLQHYADGATKDAEAIQAYRS